MSELNYLSQLDFPKHLLGTESYSKARNYVQKLPNSDEWLEEAGGLACLEHRVDWIYFNLSLIGSSAEYFSPEVFISPSNKKFISPFIRAVMFAEGIILAGASVVSREENDILQEPLLFTLHVSEKYNMGNRLRSKMALDFLYYPNESRWVIQEHDEEFKIRGEQNQEILDLVIENSLHFSSFTE